MSGQHAHEEVPRSEGDLRILWDEHDGRIAEAWCQGTMYRGYEMILIGRYPEDALATINANPTVSLDQRATAKNRCARL